MTNDLKLFLSENLSNSISKFKLKLLENDLKRINKEVPLRENEVGVNITYVIENDEGIEAEFFIRNNSVNSVNFESIGLTLNNSNSLIAEQIFDLKGVGKIPPLTAVPYVVQFDNDNIFSRDLEDVKISFNTALNLSAVVTLRIDIDNIPEGLKVKHKKAIEEFNAKLPNLRKDMVDLHSYSLSYDEENNIDVVVLARNGYESDITINSIPLSIYNNEGFMLYNGEFENVELNVSSYTAKLFSIKIDDDDIPFKNIDLLDVKVEFK